MDQGHKHHDSASKETEPASKAVHETVEDLQTAEDMPDPEEDDLDDLDGSLRPDSPARTLC